ncbi:MAG: TIM-barrel domain-containing protein [Lysobacterales bacterium]
MANLRSVAALLLLLLSFSASAADYLSHQQSGNSLHIQTSEGALTLTFQQPGAIEAHYQPTGVKQLPSYSIAAAPPPLTTAISESASQLVFASTELEARIDKKPLRISYYRKGELLLAEEKGAYAFETTRGFRFHLDPDEKLMGTGERVLGMNRRGHRLPLYNKPHYGYTTESEQMYFSLPVVMSSHKYLLVFDNSASGSVDLGKTDPDILEFQAVAGRLSYLLFAGDSYPELIHNYVRVTGTQPLPPRWAFGNYASRFGYRSEAEVREVVAKFQQADIPLDAVVIDLYWFGKDIQGHLGKLDWDRESFPNAEQMLADLSAQGIKTILVTEPFILTTSTRWQEAVAAGVLALNVAGKPKTYDFYFGNTGLIDVFKPEAATWFWNIYAGLMRQGVAGWWGDLGEPEVHPADTIHVNGTAEEVHNAYGHNWARLLYENHVATYPERRPFIMMRAGAPGSQRYGMIPWTGDVERSWGGLKPQVELALQMSLLGMAYTHSDLGGFAGGESFDADLYLRWLQYGVFQPVFRPHAQDHIASEPVFHDAQTVALARDAIRLRYRLLPYLYTLAWENSRSGMPLMRPLFFGDESDASLIDRSDAYYWGDAFLVAPITDPGQMSKSVDLPRGVWFDFWSDARHEGGKTATIAVSSATIPVLVRAGAFIPMVAPFANTGQYTTEQLELHYYADASVSSASGQMYDDDGHSRLAPDNGHNELLSFSAIQQDGSLSIELKRKGGDYPGKPAVRQMQLVVHGWKSAPQALTAGSETLVLGNQTEWESGEARAWHDNASGQVYLRFPWGADAVRVELR